MCKVDVSPFLCRGLLCLGCGTKQGTWLQGGDLEPVSVCVQNQNLCSNTKCLPYYSDDECYCMLRLARPFDFVWVQSSPATVAHALLALLRISMHAGGTCAVTAAHGLHGCGC